MTWPTKTDFVDGDVLTASQVNNIGTNLNIFDPTSATAGQLLQADGAGSAAFATIVSGGYTLLASGSLIGSASTTVSGLTLTNYKLIQINITEAVCGSRGTCVQGLGTGTDYQSWNMNSSNVGSNNNTNRWRTTNSSVDTRYVSMLIWNAGQSANKGMIATASITGSSNSTMYLVHGWCGQAYPWTAITILNDGAATYTSGDYEIFGVS